MRLLIRLNVMIRAIRASILSTELNRACGVLVIVNAPWIPLSSRKTVISIGH